MHVLLSNDDGVEALGLNELSQALPRDWRITIVAPDRECSAKSHALSINAPLYLTKLASSQENITRYSLSGTPADCVKFALDYLLKDDFPHLLLSGVNDGYNIGSDALYSGTVGAGMEGLFYNIPAAALSVRRYTSERGREILPFIVEFLQEIIVEKQFKGFLNMNFPKIGPVGWPFVRVVDQGLQRYTNIFEKKVDVRGHEYYSLAGELDFSSSEPNTDVRAHAEGFISVNALTWKQLAFEENRLLKHIVDEKATAL